MMVLRSKDELYFEKAFTLKRSSVVSSVCKRVQLYCLSACEAMSVSISVSCFLLVWLLLGVFDKCLLESCK